MTHKGYYPVANHDTQLGDWLSLGSKTDDRNSVKEQRSIYIAISNFDVPWELPHIN